MKTNWLRAWKTTGCLVAVCQTGCISEVAEPGMFGGRALAFAVVADTGSTETQESTSAERSRRNLAIASGTTQPSVPQSVSNEETMVLKRMDLLDQGMGGVVSHHVYIPEGWQGTGQATWADPAFFRVLPTPSFKATSPEGIEIEIHPNVMYSDPIPDDWGRAWGLQRPPQFHSDAGYPVLYRPQSTKDIRMFFAEWVVPDSYPLATEVQITEIKVLPELANSLRSQMANVAAANQQLQQMARQFGLPFDAGITAEAYEVRAQWLEGGVAQEYCCVWGMVNSYSRQTGMTQNHWLLSPMVSYRAPLGQLDARLPQLTRIAGTLRATAEWNQLVQRHALRMNQIDRESAAEISAITARTNSEILDMQHESFRRRQAREDAQFARVIRGIRGTQLYGCDDQVYELPAGYDYAYSNNHDTIVLTNDPWWPSRNSGIGPHHWSQLTPRD